jgi:plasmid stabilization system protein ParE
MPAAKSYRLHPQAWQDGETADDWYRERSADASVRFLSAVFDGLEDVKQFPRRWPKHLHGTQPFMLYRFPFSIIYREELSAISIIAIAHHKRRPGYWKERL